MLDTLESILSPRFLFLLVLHLGWALSFYVPLHPCAVMWPPGEALLSSCVRGRALLQSPHPTSVRADSPFQSFSVAVNDCCRIHHAALERAQGLAWSLLWGIMFAPLESMRDVMNAPLESIRDFMNAPLGSTCAAQHLIAQQMSTVWLSSHCIIPRSTLLCPLKISISIRASMQSTCHTCSMGTGSGIVNSHNLKELSTHSWRMFHMHWWRTCESHRMWGQAEKRSRVLERRGYGRPGILEYKMKFKVYEGV